MKIAFFMRFSLILAILPGACAAPIRELAVPDVRQSADYTCSAAALQAVLAYYGIEAREDTLVKEIGATPEDGAPPEAIERAARARGLKAELREGLSIADLEAAVRAGRPVIVDIQAWPDRPRTYADDWDDGHYVVVVGVEKDRLVFEDPSILGGRGVIARAAFADRWHDEDKRKRNVHAGILFDGRPAPPAPYRTIE